MSISSQPQNPRGLLVFLHSLTAVTVCLFDVYCALTSHFILLGEQDEILKNLMSQSLVTRASAVILLSVNLKWETGGRVWELFLSGTRRFLWLSSWRWLTRYNKRVYSVVQRLRACDPVCVSYHDQICLCGPSVDVCMLAYASLCMNVHMRVCVWRAEVRVLLHDNRRLKEPLASVLVLQSNCLQSQDLTPLPDVKGCEGWIQLFTKEKKRD